MEIRSKSFVEDGWQEWTSYFYIFRYPNSKIIILRRSEQCIKYRRSSKYVGPWRLWLNPKRNEVVSPKIKSKNNWYKIEFDEAICPKDQIESSHCVNI